MYKSPNPTECEEVVSSKNCISSILPIEKGHVFIQCLLKFFPQKNVLSTYLQRISLAFVSVLQVSSGPVPAAAPSSVQGQALTELLRSLASVNDATLAQQLLNQMKLEQAAADAAAADAKASSLVDGMTGAEAWPAGLAPSLSRFPWPADNSGVRQMPPPGLSQDTGGDSAMWARAGGWSTANDKFKTAAGDDHISFLFIC